MAINYKKVQAARRKTLFPLSPKELHHINALSALALHEQGFSIPAIQQILKLGWPDQARTLVAKGRRILSANPGRVK